MWRRAFLGYRAEGALPSGQKDLLVVIFEGAGTLLSGWKTRLIRAENWSSVKFSREARAELSTSVIANSHCAAVEQMHHVMISSRHERPDSFEINSFR